MKSAQFSGVSWVVVVQRSATLFSVYQHRDCLVAVLWRERLATTLTYGETAPEHSSLPKTKQWKWDRERGHRPDSYKMEWKATCERWAVEHVTMCVCVCECGHVCVCVYVTAPQSSVRAWMWGRIQRGALWSQSLIASSRGGRTTALHHTCKRTHHWGCMLSHSQHTVCVCISWTFVLTPLSKCFTI